MLKHNHGSGFYLVFPRCPHDEFPYVLVGDFDDVDDAINVACDIVQNEKPVGIDEETGEVVKAGRWCAGNFIIASTETTHDVRLAYTARFLDLSLPERII